jgi:predicted heme/steroid binding protein
MTTEELRKFDGNDGRRLCLAINGKVVEIPPAHPSYGRMHRLGASDVTLYLSQCIYDPKYGIPSSLDELSLEHRASVEHFYSESFMSRSYFEGKDCMVVVAYCALAEPKKGRL